MDTISYKTPLPNSSPFSSDNALVTLAFKFPGGITSLSEARHPSFHQLAFLVYGP